jgi:hypothetical protein
MALDEVLVDEDLLPVLARARTGRAATPTLAFPAFSFDMKLLVQCCI